MNHFKGKKPLQHLIDARLKGKMASEEIHGVELPGHINAAADAAKEAALIILLIWSLLGPKGHIFTLVFLSGWLIWKVGRSAILGFARLQRLHRVIEEERFEIEHHRPQEKEELTALYAAKGLTGKLLTEVIDVLMADDDRLLQVMLEEELGLSLEQIEHPLKQAAGVLVGVLGAFAILSFGLFVLPNFGPALCAFVVIALCAGTTAQLEKSSALPAIIWNLATAALAAGIVHFLAKMIFYENSLPL